MYYSFYLAQSHTIDINQTQKPPQVTLQQEALAMEILFQLLFYAKVNQRINPDSSRSLMLSRRRWDKRSIFSISHWLL